MKLARQILVYATVAALSMPVAANTFMRCGGSGDTTGHEARFGDTMPDHNGHHGKQGNDQQQGSALDSDTVDCECCSTVCAMAGCASVATMITPFLTFELDPVNSDMALREANPSSLPPGLFRPPIRNT